MEKINWKNHINQLGYKWITESRTTFIIILVLTSIYTYTYMFIIISKL